MPLDIPETPITKNSVAMATSTKTQLQIVVVVVVVVGKGKHTKSCVVLHFPLIWHSRRHLPKKLDNWMKRAVDLNIFTE